MTDVHDHGDGASGDESPHGRERGVVEVERADGAMQLQNTQAENVKRMDEQPEGIPACGMNRRPTDDTNPVARLCAYEVGGRLVEAGGHPWLVRVGKRPDLAHARRRQGIEDGFMLDRIGDAAVHVRFEEGANLDREPTRQQMDVAVHDVRLGGTGFLARRAFQALPSSWNSYCMQG